MALPAWLVIILVVTSRAFAFKLSMGPKTLTDLKQQAITTEVGRNIEEQKRFRTLGKGLPHADATLRLFGSTDKPRVTFYRDTAAWCPYCQKVWILLEEKKIPYKVEKINMRSYGDKPAEFLRMVPNGLLPAIALDGKIQTESSIIMMNLDRTFSGGSYKPMMPPSSFKTDCSRVDYLFRLERQLFGSWCSLVFRPSFGSGATDGFKQDLDEVNKQLAISPGPWFLEFGLSILDLVYVTHLERMFASVPYWAGFKIRGDDRWPNINLWMDAFETLPSYMATKSDYYTHVMDIPPQYGPGYRVAGEGAKRMAGRIDGSDGSWTLPLLPLSPDDLEPYGSHIDPGEEAARHEAAHKLTSNYEAVLKFALRGAGAQGTKRFQAPLADPYAVPNMSFADDVGSCLIAVIESLLTGDTSCMSIPSISPDNSLTTGKRQVQLCLEYLRDRVGVPRDMSYPAARQLRAHLNWISARI